MYHVSCLYPACLLYVQIILRFFVNYYFTAILYGFTVTAKKAVIVVQ